MGKLGQGFRAKGLLSKFHTTEEHKHTRLLVSANLLINSHPNGFQPSIGTHCNIPHRQIDSTFNRSFNYFPFIFLVQWAKHPTNPASLRENNGDAIHDVGNAPFVLIGRAGEQFGADVLVNHPDVSKLHAALVHHEGGKIYIIDLASVCYHQPALPSLSLPLFVFNKTNHPPSP